MVMGSGRFYVIMYSACYSSGRVKYPEIRVWERLVWNSIFKFDFVFIFICDEFNERSVNKCKQFSSSIFKLVKFIFRSD